MGAVNPFPGDIHRYDCCEDEHSQTLTHTECPEFGLSHPGIEDLTLQTSDTIDMAIPRDHLFHYPQGMERYITFAEPCSRIDAPHGWHAGFQDWHDGKGSPNRLPHDLKIPFDASSGGRWTTTEHDSNYSGGSTWSPRTSDSRSEVDGIYSSQLPSNYHPQGLGISSYLGASSHCEEIVPHIAGVDATGIVPKDIQLTPDEYPEDIPSRPDLEESMTVDHYFPEDGKFSSQQLRLGPDDSGLGSSIYDSKTASTRDEEDDIPMDDEDAEYDSDEYDPAAERLGHHRRASQKSLTKRNTAPAPPKRSQRAKTRPTYTVQKPSKVTKNSSKTPSSPTSNRTYANQLFCPECSISFPSDSTLKKHVLATHTRPFICTFHNYGCTSTVGSKNEWKRHINVQHLHLETWRCDIGPCAAHSACSSNTSHHHLQSTDSPQPIYRDFDRKDLFTQHIKRMHPPPSQSKADKAYFESSISNAQVRCHLKLRDAPTGTICPYCGPKVSFENWDDRIEHVGKHLEKGDVNAKAEMDDARLREWMIREGFFTPVGRGWRVKECGKKRRKSAVGSRRGGGGNVNVEAEEVEDEDEEDEDEDAEGEDEV
ncbi:hypothetical protein MMC28_000171 [Mycoblastus sanguinarius]|nr:hypothetical protein [Mycoblastus sanguinarius]